MGKRSFITVAEGGRVMVRVRAKTEQSVPGAGAAGAPAVMSAMASCLVSQGCGQGLTPRFWVWS